jgi:predicted dehydrogenase
MPPTSEPGRPPIAGLRVAIVGTGGIAKSHIRALRSLPMVEVVAAVDPVADRVAAYADENGIGATYADLDDLLASGDKPDVVHLCTPPGLHADHAVAALEAGVHVVCEKPPVLTMAELERIQRTAVLSGHWFTTIFQHRFGSGAQHLRRLMSEGVLGAPRVAICHTLWHRPDPYYDVPWRGNWELEGGGPTLGHGIHQIDLLTHLLGEWTEVTGTAVRLARPIETEDVSMAHVAFASGALASVVTSVLSPREESYLRFDFDNATVEVSHLYGYTDSDWTITPAKHVDDTEAAGWQLTGEPQPSGHAAQLALVYAALAAGSRPEADSDSALQTMALITGIYASGWTNRPVRRADLTDKSPFHGMLPGTADRPVPAAAGPLHPDLEDSAR